MATGTYAFTVPVAGLRLEQTEVANSHPSVEKIVIETQDDERMSVVFHLTDIFTETEADAIKGHTRLHHQPSRVRTQSQYRSTASEGVFNSQRRIRFFAHGFEQPTRDVGRRGARHHVGRH